MGTAFVKSDTHLQILRVDVKDLPGPTWEPPLEVKRKEDAEKTQAHSDFIDQECRRQFSRIWKIRNYGLIRSAWHRFLFVIGR